MNRLIQRAKTWSETLIQHRLLKPRSAKRWLSVVTAIACFAVWGCSSSVQAGAQVDAKFKEQVLQVIRENPQVILESVRDYQQQQQKAQDESRQAFLQTMQRDRKAAIGNSPTKGDGNILLIEFSDFQCPYCSKAQDTLNQMLTKYPGKVTLVYKHFPLTQIHSEALPAAKASWAAGQQGKFWEYHDALFRQQEKLGNELYQQLATTLNLDLKKFERDRTSPTAEAAVNEDLKTGEKLGVEGTPSFFASGENFAGAIQLPDLEAVLAKAGAQ
jgi:protein-disulfide isomerase